MHEQICKELTDLYNKKSNDYGDSFSKQFKEYGMLSSVIRLDDKLNRLKTLLNNKQMVHDESVKDTLMDLANYSILTLMEMRSHEHTDK